MTKLATLELYVIFRTRCCEMYTPTFLKTHYTIKGLISRMKFYLLGDFCLGVVVEGARLESHSTQLIFIH